MTNLKLIGIDETHNGKKILTDLLLKIETNGQYIINWFEYSKDYTYNQFINAIKSMINIKIESMNSWFTIISHIEINDETKDVMIEVTNINMVMRLLSVVSLNIEISDDFINMIN